MENEFIKKLRSGAKVCMGGLSENCARIDDDPTKFIGRICRNCNKIAARFRYAEKVATAKQNSIQTEQEAEQEVDQPKA